MLCYAATCCTFRPVLHVLMRVPECQLCWIRFVHVSKQLLAVLSKAPNLQFLSPPCDCFPDKSAALTQGIRGHRIEGAHAESRWNRRRECLLAWKTFLVAVVWCLICGTAASFVVSIKPDRVPLRVQPGIFQINTTATQLSSRILLPVFPRPGSFTIISLRTRAIHRHHLHHAHRPDTLPTRLHHLTRIPLKDPTQPTTPVPLHQLPLPTLRQRPKRRINWHAP
jgi:hypothetical protein